MMSKAQMLVVLSDILKWENSPQSRIAISAPKGTKMGDLVKYPLRNQYLVALTDEEAGKVKVQPHNCRINLKHVNIPNDINGEPFNVNQWVKQADMYGIQYVGADDSIEDDENLEQGSQSEDSAKPKTSGEKKPTSSEPPPAESSEPTSSEPPASDTDVVVLPADSRSE